MNKQLIDQQLAALNSAWQRYVSPTEEQLDQATAEVLNQAYLAAWEGLDAYGIAEWMLEYDPATLTFSLLTTAKRNEQVAKTRWSENNSEN